MLIVLDTIEIGGPGKGILQYCAYNPGSIDVILVNFDYGSRAKQTFNSRAEELGVPLLKIHQRSKLDFSCIDYLVKVVRKEKVSLIQSHNFKSHVVAARVARRSGIPWLAFAHGWTAQSARVRIYNRIEIQILRLADHLCVVSNALKESFLKKRFRADKVSVIKNAVEVSKVRRSGNRTPGQPFTILCVGRLSQEKGQDLLLDALASAELKCPWKIKIVGDGPTRQALETKATQQGLGGKVEFLGYLEDITYLYHQADLLVVPSRSEGIPNVILEAMALGTPVLATAVGGVPDIIEDGRTGFLVSEAKVHAIAKKLRWACCSWGELASCGDAARNEMIEKWSPEVRTLMLIGLQKSLIEQYLRSVDTE